MKFDCDTRANKRRQWHRWFAWYPVRVGRNDCRWLEAVERRGEYHGSYDPEWEWEYRSI